MAKIDVSQTVTDLATTLLTSQGMELVDLEYKREGRDMVLRLFVDKPGGVTLDDCAAVNRELSEILDVEDVIASHYILEVSSPGLNRPLKKLADYERYRGRLVKIRTFELLPDDLGNKRKTFLGELLGLENGIVRLKLKEGQTAGIALDKIAKANLEFEF
jgi:ribosome maturation factor RimP